MPLKEVALESLSGASEVEHHGTILGFAFKTFHHGPFSYLR